MEQLLNYYLNNMLMSASVGGYETQLSLRSTFNFGIICSAIIGYVMYAHLPRKLDREQHFSKLHMQPFILIGWFITSVRCQSRGTL